jgi:hypothetical protein
MIRSFVRANRSAAAFLERTFPRFFLPPFPSFSHFLSKVISDEVETNRRDSILEVGGIDRPLLSKSATYKYIGLDIETKPNCGLKYDQFLVQSIELDMPPDIQANMVISTTLLEHVRDNDAAFRVMFNVLASGGCMHHYVPSKWHPYSICLRMVGPNIQKRLIPILRSHAADVTGYEAFFHRCSIREMKRLAQDSGFENIRVKPFYRFENLCERLNIETCASGFVISCSKP